MDSAQDGSAVNMTLNSTFSKSNHSLVKATVSGFLDRFGDTVGYIITVLHLQDRRCLLEARRITEREYQIIELIVAGNTNSAIASFLGITLRTAETHISNIYSKLSISNRSELINYYSDLPYNPPI